MSMKSYIYVYVSRFAWAVGHDITQIDDNPRVHVTNSYFKQGTIERMDWPGKEHAWNILQKTISARQD